MYDLTMLAFHGKRKPPTLQKLLSDVLGAVMANLPISIAWSFAAYQLAQMHATIIGMEVDVRNGRCFGRWFSENWKEERPIDVDRLHAVVRRLISDRGNRLFTIRFGGFPGFHCSCAKDHPEGLDGWLCASGTASEGFHSCDRTGYDGSFYTTPGPVMITGWPVNSPDELDAFPHSLYDFRRSLEDAGFSDKYHYGNDQQRAHWKDDDFFIKIGTFACPPSKEQREAIDAAVRDYLSNRKPMSVDVTADDVSIVLYDDPSLDESHVRDRVTLKQFLDEPTTVKNMYEIVLQQRAG